jgi:hypothetical protein
MKIRFATLPIILLILLSANLIAHEDDAVVVVSTINGNNIDSLPSDEFLGAGKTLDRGDLFDFDIEKVITSAKSASKKIKGFHEEFYVANLIMQTYPNPFSRKWFFVVTLVDKNKNIVRIIINTNGEVWPFGKAHDPFQVKPNK